MFTRERKKKELRKKNKEEERKEGRKWYGITSMGKYTERLKYILRSEGIRTFRKGGNKFEYEVKEKMGKKKNNKKNKEEGVVYKVNCKNCENIYIGETRFKMKKRIEEHKKVVGVRRISNSAMARHVEEFDHEIDWEKTIGLEKEKILFPRKILESAYIKENKER